MSTDPVAQLASQLVNGTTTGPPQPTIVQGKIVSWQSSASPPTVTITLSGDTTQIPGIQYLDSYTPVVGDVVQIAKQNGSLLILGRISQVVPVTAPMAQGSGSSDPQYGGVTRTTQAMFWYCNSAVVTVSGASGWSWTSGGVAISGCGVVQVCAGDNSGGLAFVNVAQSLCNVSGGNLTVGGQAFQWDGAEIAGISGGTLIRVNISALCW